MSALAAILVCVGAVAFVAWIVLKFFKGSGPMGPKLPGWSGNGLTFKAMKATLWRDDFLEAMEQYPRVMMFEVPITLRAFMPGRTYFVNDPELMNEITLSRGYKEFVNHPKQENRITELLNMSKALINIRDEEWKQQRKTITPSFHWANIRPMIPIFNDICEKAVQVIRKSDGGVIMFEELVHKLTIDTIGTTSFGVEFDSLTDESSHLTDSLLNMTVRFNASSARMLLFLPFWDYLPIPPLRRFLQGITTVMATAKAMANQRQRDSSLRRDDLLQILLDARDEQGNPLTEEEIIPNAFLFLLAGEGTTAGTITWAMYEISQHAEVEEKLLEEIDDMLKGENPTQDNIHRLKYLDMVLKEVLRRHPAADLTNRDCNVDAEIDGMVFPKGTNFLINIWGFHHSPKYWKDPMKFDPERFSEERKHELVPHTYLPFGAGPRKCIGFRFAIAEMKVALVHFVRNFHFEYAGDKSPDSTTALNASPEGGMPLRVACR